MKAEQRKQIETNSLVLAVQRIRKHASGRTLYYVIGTVALVLGGILLYRHFAGETRRTRDEIIRQLAAADTPEKLREGMEQHRGTVYGSMFKLHLARHHLSTEGLPRLGTEGDTARRQAAASVEKARTYFLELTGELKEKEEPGMVQDAWAGAAEAEEGLVGLPTDEGKTDSRGSVDKVIEYYEKAASIFPDREFSKRYKQRAEKISATREQFVKDQQAIHRPRDLSSLEPRTGKSDAGPFGPSPSVGPPKAGPEVPPLGPPMPSAKPPEPKPADPPKGADPKAK